MSDFYENIYTNEERKQLVAYSLQNFRKTKKYTQQFVADKIGISAQTYATYERGRNEPPIEILVRLSYLYNIPIDIIVQRDNVEKSTFALKNQFQEFENVIEEMRTKVLSGDPETREQIKILAEAMGTLADKIKDFKGIDTK